LAALLHGTRAVGVSQTLRRTAEGAGEIRQGGHHVGHQPTFYEQPILHLPWGLVDMFFGYNFPKPEPMWTKSPAARQRQPSVNVTGLVNGRWQF